MSHLSPALCATLVEVVPDLHVHCVDPWCVIGSTAALLLGAEVSAADVDVLTSREDADALITLWADRREPISALVDSELFRSRFGRFRFPGAPVEVMGALELNRGHGWHTVQAGRLMLASFNGLAVPIPCIDDQLRLLERFGRAKDLRHAAALRALNSRTFNLPVVTPP